MEHLTFLFIPLNKYFLIHLEIVPKYTSYQRHGSQSGLTREKQIRIDVSSRSDIWKKKKFILFLYHIDWNDIGIQWHRHYLRKTIHPRPMLRLTSQLISNHKIGKVHILHRLIMVVKSDGDHEWRHTSIKLQNMTSIWDERGQKCRLLPRQCKHHCAHQTKEDKRDLLNF